MSKAITVLKQLSTAESTFNKFKGLFAIYKPPDIDLLEIYHRLKYVMYQGINQLPNRQVEDIVKIDQDNNLIYLDKNLADTVQASGPKYVRRDFQLDFLHPLHKNDSGVVVCSVNDDKKLLNRVENALFMRVYEIKGRLGVWTDDFTPHGRLVERATYNHVNRAKIDRIMASIQATYQREMMRYAGLDIQSQEAYEMASRGLLRPENTSTPPQIYSIRCIELDRPYFRLELHTINESNRFMRNLIHDIGLKLKTYAICVQIRRVKDGFVEADSPHCLPHTDWEFQNIYESTLSMSQLAKKMLKKHEKTIIIGKGKKESHEVLKNELTPRDKASQFEEMSQ